MSEEDSLALILIANSLGVGIRRDQENFIEGERSMLKRRRDQDSRQRKFD